MPQTDAQWIWFYFFAGGALLGWLVFLGRVAAAARDLYREHAELRRMESQEFVGEYEDPPAGPSFGGPYPRTRSNLPVYTPRKRAGGAR